MIRCSDSLLLFAKKKKKRKQKNNSNLKSNNEGIGFGGRDGSGASEDTKLTKTTVASEMTVEKLNSLFYNDDFVDDEGDAIVLEETNTLRDRYTREHLLQIQRNTNKSNIRRQLVQVSESPLIFTIDDFLDPEMCKSVQNDAAGCFNLYYPETLSDELFNGQENDMDGLLFNTASSNDHPDNVPYPDGLHMDTNNQCQNRHVTCILYLNDVPEECGGATVFPLARTLPTDPVLASSQRLLAQRISHTRNRKAINKLGLEADAELLETRLSTNFTNNPDKDTAIQIQPKAGRLLVFFSRDNDGKEDPRAWHGGGRILCSSRKNNGSAAVSEKRILTLFKETSLPPNTTTTSGIAGDLEVRLAPQIAEQRKWLQAKAKLQLQKSFKIGAG